MFVSPMTYIIAKKIIIIVFPRKSSSFEIIKISIIIILLVVLHQMHQYFCCKEGFCVTKFNKMDYFYAWSQCSVICSKV